MQIVHFSETQIAPRSILRPLRELLDASLIVLGSPLERFGKDFDGFRGAVCWPIPCCESASDASRTLFSLVPSVGVLLQLDVHAELLHAASAAVHLAFPVGICEAPLLYPLSESVSHVAVSMLFVDLVGP